MSSSYVNRSGVPVGNARFGHPEPYSKLGAQGSEFDRAIFLARIVARRPTFEVLALLYEC